MNSEAALVKYEKGIFFKKNEIPEIGKGLLTTREEPSEISSESIEGQDDFVDSLYREYFYYTWTKKIRYESRL